jgi:hypothetical protein
MVPVKICFICGPGVTQAATHATVDAKEHFLFQDGQPVFKMLFQKWPIYR